LAPSFYQAKDFGNKYANITLPPTAMKPKTCKNRKKYLKANSPFKKAILLFNISKKK
jgi:hypothetical protein